MNKMLKSYKMLTYIQIIYKIKNKLKTFKLIIIIYLK